MKQLPGTENFGRAKREEKRGDFLAQRTGSARDLVSREAVLGRAGAAAGSLTPPLVTVLSIANIKMSRSSKSHLPGNDTW